MVKIEGKRSDNPLYKRIKSVYFNMMQRCYNKNFPKYEYYGGSGVTVCKEWQTLEGFINTIDTVEGWDEALFIQGKLELDKDTKIPNNKVYSPYTCRFISPYENRLNASKKRMKLSVAISPEGKRYEFYNRTKFCEKHGLDDVTVYRCLIGERYHHKNWKFYYADGSTKLRTKRRSSIEPKYAISPDNTYYEFKNVTEFAKEHNLKPKGIRLALSGQRKTYKKWKFGYK